jgi:excinuclease ABC subunit C
VAAAQRALDELGIDDVAVCGIAKRFEEVWLPEEADPIVLPRRSEGLYLLQRVRDEAHHFAITFHRAKRSKSMVASELDNVPGLGPARRTALLRHFGSLKRLREADAERITEVPGVGRHTAEAIVAALRPGGGGRPEPGGDRPEPGGDRPEAAGGDRPEAAGGHEPTATTAERDAGPDTGSDRNRGDSS